MGPALSESQIVFLVTPLVAVTLDRDRRIDIAQLIGVLAQRRSGVGADVGIIEIEVDRDELEYAGGERHRLLGYRLHDLPILELAGGRGLGLGSRFRPGRALAGAQSENQGGRESQYGH